MNKRQLEMAKVNADAEVKVMKELKQVYTQARKDCAAKISELSGRTDMENLQSIVYQKQYQEAMQKQIDGVLDVLNGNSFQKVSDYLGVSYENGFFGTLYDLQGQGIPLCFPIDQTQVVEALQTDSKISKGLYNRMGEDTTYLKKSIRAELSRGILNGSSYNEMAAKIAYGMNSPFNKAFKRTKTIARTEGHRVQAEATFHCQQKAKEKGADVKKQWDSTHDKKTRPHHGMLDGQVRELDEPFEVDGLKAMYPSGFGTPSEDCNCRCCLLQRAAWALTDEKYTKMNNDTKELVKINAKGYTEFKEAVKETLQTNEVINNNPVLKGMIETLKGKLGVQCNPVQSHSKPLAETEIVKTLSGGDKTSGSCASVGLAYVGQKNGLDVLDFRGGESHNFFSNGFNLRKIAEFPNLSTVSETARAASTAGNKLLSKVEEGNEYYFVCGKHASIVRKNEGVLQYLELQSANRSGWTDFDGNPRYTLATRFGAKQSGRDCEAYMFNVENAKDSKELQTLLGYINTSVDEQKKGVHGGIK